MNISQTAVSGNSGGKNDILKEVAARFKQIIDFNCNEVDEQKLREKFDSGKVRVGQASFGKRTELFKEI